MFFKKYPHGVKVRIKLHDVKFTVEYTNNFTLSNRLNGFVSWHVIGSYVKSQRLSSHFQKQLYDTLNEAKVAAIAQYDKMIKLSEEQKKSDAEAKERIRQRQKSNIIVWDYP